MADVIPFEVKDYLAEAQSRVTEQFRNSKEESGIKKVFGKYLELLIQSQLEIQQTIKDLMQLRDVDSATGAQLDVIGRIVGQERELIAADLYEYFGFQGAVGAQSFGQYGTSFGGYFKSESTPAGTNVPLDDDNYRKYIKAKIFKNITASTPEEFIAVVNLIFNTTQAYVLEGEEAEFTLYFGRPITDFEKSLLNYISYKQSYPTRLLPKTVGVKMNLDYTGIPDFTGGAGYGLSYGTSYGS